jgi:FkbM family methyltransferase
MVLQIFYGIKELMINVTRICYTKLTSQNIMIIPADDHTRSYFFTDPLLGTLKKVFICSDNVWTEYEHCDLITINLLNYSITINNDDIHAKLQKIHSTLKINHGSFHDESPEQHMSMRHLTGNEKVLEIGGNIGRNSLVIASILNSNDFVSLECDVNNATMLEENRNINGLHFHIEKSALSKRKLIQRGWDTIPSDVLLEGYQPVNTITWQELQNKYNIVFDTLVLDCEGAFYYILMDTPEILNDIKLIIIENDYKDLNHKLYVEAILKHNQFHRAYVESLNDPNHPWKECFFETWKR